MNGDNSTDCGANGSTQVTADFAAMLARLDEEENRLQPYANAEGGRSTPAPSRARMLALIQEFRHVIQYANDAESGNRVLREENERLRNG